MTKVEQLADELESIVDRADVGIGGVLLALAEVCAVKAAHLRHNWQDEASAREWDRAGRVLDKAYAKLT